MHQQDVEIYLKEMGLIFRKRKRKRKYVNYVSRVEKWKGLDPRDLEFKRLDYLKRRHGLCSLAQSLVISEFKGFTYADEFVSSNFILKSFDKDEKKIILSIIKDSAIIFSPFKMKSKVYTDYNAPFVIDQLTKDLEITTFLYIPAGEKTRNRKLLSMKRIYEALIKEYFPNKYLSLVFQDSNIPESEEPDPHANFYRKKKIYEEEARKIAELFLEILKEKADTKRVHEILYKPFAEIEKYQVKRFLL